jgi:hypothetical protein
MSHIRKTILNILAGLLLLVPLALAPRAAAAGPQTWKERETSTATFTGTWTWDADRKAFGGRWNNGAVAWLRPERFDAEQVVLVRTDPETSSSAGLTARYSGRRAGGVITGTVDWTWRGSTWRGTWRADLVPDPLPRGTPDDPMTPQQVSDVFARMAAQTDIAFRYPVDGCYARTHLMVRRMQAQGLSPRKVWAFRNGDLLQVRTPFAPAGFVDWDYHVAPLLRVRYGKGDWDMVIDPSLFDGPATAEQWAGAMKKAARSNPFVTVTNPGEAPVRPDGKRAPGSGYWPGADPTDPDAFSRDVMARFKPLEKRYR